MKKQIIGTHSVEYYDSIEEIPVKIHHKFNRYMLIDGGIGSDMNDVNDHISKIRKFIRADEKDKADILLENLRQSLYLVTEEVNVKLLSFMVLITKINGVQVTDYSDEAVKARLKLFEETPIVKLYALVESFKKKVEAELNAYFPGNFNDAAVKEYYDTMVKKALLQLDGIIRDTSNNEALEEIENYLLLFALPKVFGGANGAEIKYEKQFEDMCIYLQTESLNVDNMTTLQFYNAFEYLKKSKKSNGR